MAINRAEMRETPISRIDLRDCCGVAMLQFVQSRRRLPMNDETEPCLHEKCFFWQNGKCPERYGAYIERMTRFDEGIAEVTE